MFNKLRSSSAITVYVPPAVYSAGSIVSGEVHIDFRQLQEEKIEEVSVRLRGTSKTWIHRDKVNTWEFITLVNESTSVWQRGAEYPAAGEDVLRIPFALTLPEQLPPSLIYNRVFEKAMIRYSVSAVGARKGVFTPNKKHRVPLAVLPRDTVGAEIRAEHATHAMKTTSKEDHIRKGLWGEYSKVRVELALPDIPVLPLFSDIPYAITVITTSAPLSKAKADAHPLDKLVFPPVPAAPHGLEFALHRNLTIRAKWMRATSSAAVAHFLGGRESDRKNLGAVGFEVPAREWVPLDAITGANSEKGKDKESGSVPADVDPDTKGVWVQRATVEGTLKLNCSPSLALHNIECAYKLLVKVPFPGIGNGLKLELPVTVTSGIDQPLAKDSSETEDAPPILDLPPAYWDADDKDWGDDEKDS
ncbi:hypothetical protein C8Q74DRAFT_1214134 [Fomes fomentarius]|nr:hypothetical protein C8Q74DRAFT_1214134 [Fomes fomentarius]